MKLIVGSPGSTGPGDGQGLPPSGFAPQSLYDQMVIGDGPVSYLRLGAGPVEASAVGASYGTYSEALATTALPNGDLASVFNGTSDYVALSGGSQESPSTTGQLTVEAWLRPDTLTFPTVEGSGYVRWIGKASSLGSEWGTRIYSQGNTEGAANRIGAYAYNPSGSVSASASFTDTVTAGQWMHVALVVNAVAISTPYPTGYVSIYKNGVLRDQEPLGSVVLGSTSSPMRVGSADLVSFFEGAIGKVAVYARELSATQLLAHYTRMTS